MQRVRLDSQAQLLILMNTLYLTSIAFSNTFVNIYLWKIKNDFTLIGVFNLLTFTAMPVAFYLGGKIVKKVDRVISIRIGVMVLAIFYSIVLLLGQGTAHFAAPLGFLLGIGAGFYWLGYNVMYFEITGPENRDFFNGKNGLLASLSGMIAPFIAGWLIKVNPIGGYRILFFLSFLVFMIAVGVSFFIKKRELKGSLSLKKPWHDTIWDTRWNKMMLAHYFFGLREGLTAFLISLLVFISVSSEFRLGIFTFAVSAVSLLAYYLVGRILVPQKRVFFIFLGAAMLSLMVVPLFFNVHYVWLMVMGLGSAIFYPVFLIPLTSTTFDVIGEDPEKARLRVEYIIMREISFSSGRVTGIGFFVLLVLWTKQIILIILLLFAMNTALLLSSWLMRKAMAMTMHKKEEKRQTTRENLVPIFYLNGVNTLSEKYILAYFNSPEQAKEAARQIQPLGVIDMQIDRVDPYPGDGIDRVMSPISGKIPGLASLTLDADAGSKDASVLMAADPSASGMSGGIDENMGRDVLLTVVIDDQNHHQALNIVRQNGGLV